MPFLDDHRRRVPPQNVYRSIVVCIRAVAAMAADKRRLVLAALSVYGSALGAGLRCVVGRHLAQVTATFFQLIPLSGRVASITGQARSTLTRENGQPTDSNLAQPSSVILLRARTPICASVF